MVNLTPAAQPSSNPSPPASEASAPVSAKSPSLAPSPNSGSSAAAHIALSAYPKWSDLSNSERTALKPLASLWPQMTSAHKNKWLALSANFAELSPSDQEKLQNRMTQWGSLTSEQRAQARFIFNQVQQIPSDDRLSKWQAYQALNAEQRDLLAQDALMLPTALPVRPSPSPHKQSAKRSSMIPSPLAPPESTWIKLPLKLFCHLGSWHLRLDAFVAPALSAKILTQHPFLS